MTCWCVALHIPCAEFLYLKVFFFFSLFLFTVSLLNDTRCYILQPWVFSVKNTRRDNDAKIRLFIYKLRLFLFVGCIVNLNICHYLSNNLFFYWINLYILYIYYPFYNKYFEMLFVCVFCFVFAHSAERFLNNVSALFNTKEVEFEMKQLVYVALRYCKQYW